MDPTQILLFSVVTVLTILLVAVGVQVFFILREAKKALEKTNKILEDASFVSGAVAKPVAGLASFVDGLKSIRDLIDLVSQRSRQESLGEYEQESLQEGEKEHTQIESLQERGRRFFHKEGKPLTS